jgi:hypothetical protein
MRWSDGSYLEDQDKWWLSGIYREVCPARTIPHRSELNRFSDTGLFNPERSLHPNL